MKNKSILFLFLVHSLITFSQSFSSHSIALTPTANPSINFDKEAYKSKLYKKFATEPKSSDLDRYIANDVIYKEDFFSSNKIYSNWPKATEYVKSVFERTVPKEFNTSDIKIYVVRDPSPNAFCMEDGNIAITVGLLSYMNTEAELATVLGHEYGHYYSNHSYNDFKKINNNKHFKKFIQNRSILGSLMIMQDQSTYRQDQERQADTFAYHFFNKNGYSPESIAETFVQFQKISNKYNKLTKYRKPLIYFATHPSEEERVKNARRAFAGKDVSGKKFQIDSVSFVEIKKRAKDETIYLLFEQLNYSECLEMAYLQYLYYPNDEFYLFFITECLRRQMVYEKDFAEEFFITGCYKNLIPSAKHLSQAPVFLNGKYSNTLNPKNYAKSIFANFQNEIFDLSDKDLLNIKAKELITNDTLEFLFNEDALTYFSSKISPNSCVFNMRRMLVGEPLINGCDNKPEISELENDYLRTVNDYKLLKQNVSSYKKAPLILYNFKTYSTSGQLFSDDMLFKELYQQYVQVASIYSSDIIDTKNKFNFREQQKIENTTSFIESLDMKRFFSKKELSVDFLNVFPELSNEINAFNYRKLIFIELSVYGVSSSGSPLKQPVFGGEMWYVTMFIIDLANNKIELKGKKSETGGSREYKITDLLNACVAEAER